MGILCIVMTKRGTSICEYSRPGNQSPQSLPITYTITYMGSGEAPNMQEYDSTEAESQAVRDHQGNYM